MSQAGRGWWIPVKMILQFTARGKENREFKSHYLRGSYVPSAYLGSVKWWSSGFLQHVVQWFFHVLPHIQGDWLWFKCTLKWLGEWKVLIGQFQGFWPIKSTERTVSSQCSWEYQVRLMAPKRAIYLTWNSQPPFIWHRSYLLFLYNQSTSSSQSLLQPPEPNCHHKDEGSMFLQNMRTNPLYLRAYEPRRPSYE